MREMKVLNILDKVILGWLPREPVAGDASHPRRRDPTNRIGRLASFFVFEVLVVFTSLSFLQLVGLGDYWTILAGVIAADAAIVGNVLYFKPLKGSLRAQVAGFEIPSPQLTHVIDWLGGLVIEGAVSEVDRQAVQDRLAGFRKGEAVSYDLITDKGKAKAGMAVIKGVVTRGKSDGSLRFTISMRRVQE